MIHDGLQLVSAGSATITFFGWPRLQRHPRRSRPSSRRGLRAWCGRWSCAMPWAPTTPMQARRLHGDGGRCMEEASRDEGRRLRNSIWTFDKNWERKWSIVLNFTLRKTKFNIEEDQICHPFLAKVFTIWWELKYITDILLRKKPLYPMLDHGLYWTKQCAWMKPGLETQAL